MKILVVDDSPFILKMIQHGLEARFESVEIDVVEPTSQGLPELNELFTYDLLVIDRNLGIAGDGFDWISDSMGELGMPPVIMISADDLDRLSAKARAAGVMQVIEKSPALVSTVAAWVRRLRADVAA